MTSSAKMPIKKNVDPEKMARLAQAMYKWSRYEDEQNNKKIKSVYDEKLELISQHDLLLKQLADTKQQLDSAIKTTLEADQFTVSSEGMSEITGSFERILKKAILGQSVSPELEKQLRDMINHALDSEREKILQREQQIKNEEVELLKKKVERLTQKLDVTQSERDEARNWLASMGDGSSLPANVYKAGLKEDDPMRGRKKYLMKEIYEQNLEIRRVLGMEVKNIFAADESPRVKESTAFGVETKTPVDDENENLNFTMDHPAGISAASPAVQDTATKEMPGSDLVSLMDEHANLPEMPGSIVTNPDDMPWSPEPASKPESASQASSPVKKIASQVKNTSAPPLERKKNNADGKSTAP